MSQERLSDRDIYKQYVDKFASSEDPAFVSDHAFNLRFYYAEILWTLAEWQAAAAVTVMSGSARSKTAMENCAGSRRAR